MRTRNAYIEKAAKKLGLTSNIVTNIILYNHQINKLIPKKKLKTVSVNLGLETRKFINKVAKVLKVDEDAVIATALIDYLEVKDAELQADKKNDQKS